MFTNYMAISNMSSTMGNKFAGYIKEWIPFDMTFILLGGIGFGAPHFPDLDKS
jgi:hypothetical protein